MFLPVALETTPHLFAGLMKYEEEFKSVALSNWTNAWFCGVTPGLTHVAYIGLSRQRRHAESNTKIVFVWQLVDENGWIMGVLTIDRPC